MVVGKNTGVGQVSVGQDVEVVILTKDNTKNTARSRVLLKHMQINLAITIEIS